MLDIFCQRVYTWSYERYAGKQFFAIKPAGFFLPIIRTPFGTNGRCRGSIQKRQPRWRCDSCFPATSTPSVCAFLRQGGIDEH
jgi:hypothetical protein